MVNKLIAEIEILLQEKLKKLNMYGYSLKDFVDIKSLENAIQKYADSVQKDRLI